MSRKCDRCGVIVMDRTESCPLCHMVLSKEEEEGRGMNYPEISAKVRKFTFFMRVLLFLCVVASMTCIVINFQTNRSIWWSAIVTGSVFYLYQILYIMTSKKMGYLARINYTVIMTVALQIVIDVATGFHRWSVNFSLPAAIFVCNVVVIILMIVNHRNWQSYMIYQLVTIVLALIPFILMKMGIVTKPIVSEIAVLSSISVFLGTLIIGGGAARAELGRRFHI